MSAPVHRRPTAAHLRAAVEGRYPAFLAGLELMTGVDSGSYDSEGVRAVGAMAAERLRGLGFAVRSVPVGSAPDGRRLGDALIARRAGRTPGGGRLLLMAHLDTVYETGTAAARPLRIEDGTAYGPGVCDDKGGLLLGIAAIGALHDLGADDYGEVVFLCTPDEEIGSPGSRPLTETLAKEADFGLCLECARENGDLVTARKGVVDLRLTVRGRAAHSGVEPERGANAALAAAHLVIALQRLGGGPGGTTVNVGRVRAGSRTNVVCDRAVLDVEVRSATRDGLWNARREIARLASRTWVEGTSVEVAEGEECPPLERTPQVAALADEALAIAAELGVGADAAETGGVADANFAAGAGLPVLDGLGPVGGGDHSPGEWLDLTSVVPRGALLAALISRLGTRGAG
ncbi:M20 family metallopeptidase [Streptomyces sp. HK10]|uniref:M20 family metallopeptidase n=1 Tax=Streptomyces sp. HK10 TaxID=3373255 RepID=UPI00374A31CB